MKKHPLVIAATYGIPILIVLGNNAMYVDRYNLRSEAMAYNAGIYRDKMEVISNEAIIALLVFIILVRLEVYHQWIKPHAAEKAPAQDPET